MDTSKPVTHVSLCAGYGGIDLGLKRAVPNLRTIAVSEVEAFACANLVAKMEAGYLDVAPVWTDVKTFPWQEFRGKVDILSGGYPCQPFSAAGKRLGKDDPRHLWPWIADGIRVCRPAMCFFENVEGHISLGLREVIGELEEIGYRATWGVFSAAEVGAPHQRKRVFILAYDTSAGLERLRAYAGEPLNSQFGDRCLSIWPSRPGQQQFPWEPPRVVAHGDSGKQSKERGNNGEMRCVSETQCQPEHSSGLLGREGEDGGNSSTPPRVVGDADSGRLERPSAESGRTQNVIRRHGENARWQTQPTLGGDADGPAGGMDYAQLCVSGDNRTDELRLLGNGVVPATAERAFRTLIARFFA